MLTSAFENHAPHGGVIFNIMQRIIEVLTHVHTERIPSLGSVHGKRSDSIFEGDFKMRHDGFLGGSGSYLQFDT